MAVKAVGSVTVASVTDVASTTRWYLLQSSTLSAPSKPTASPPGGSWAATEPTYSEGSTSSLYTCDLTTFSDGTWAYSSVSLSTSYEASKVAYNKAVAAAAAAAATDQHFWADTDGAHVSSTGDHDLSGANLLLTATKLAFRQALVETATFAADLIELGNNSTSAAIKFCGGLAKIKAQANSTFSAVFLGTTTPSTMGGIYLTRDVDNITGETLNDAAKGCIGIDKGNGARTAVHLCAQDLTVVPSTTTQSGTYDMARFATAIQPVVLYNGGAALDYDTAPGAGTAGTVTLSETAANFKEIVLYLTDNNGGYAGAFPIAPLPGATSVANGQTADCFGFEAADAAATSTFIRRTRYTVTGGTTLVPSNGGYVWLQSSLGVSFSADGVNYLKIYRVEGRR